jgi:hypothetical protein
MLRRERQAFPLDSIIQKFNSQKRGYNPSLYFLTERAKLASRSETKTPAASKLMAFAAPFLLHDLACHSSKAPLRFEHEASHPLAIGLAWHI